MDINFIINNLNKIKLNKYFRITIGKEILGYKIVDNKLHYSQIKEIITKLSKENFNFKKIKESIRIYKYLNMIYNIKQDNQECYQENVIENNKFKIDSIIIKSYLLNKEPLGLEMFPCKDIYHDIINRNIFKIIINNIFIINFIFDENCRGNYLKLEIEIMKQNIYLEKIKKELIIILNIIIDSFKNINIEDLKDNKISEYIKKIDNLIETC